MVVGGGLSATGPALLDGIDSRIAVLMKPLREPPPTILAVHGTDSGIIGAALLGGRSAYSRPNSISSGSNPMPGSSDTVAVPSGPTSGSNTTGL